MSFDTDGTRFGRFYPLPEALRRLGVRSYAAA
jgi:hypothetical protein